MCLSYLTKTVEEDEEIHVGYKVMEGKHTPMEGCKLDMNGKWVEDDKTYTLSTEDFPRVGYTTGFHICSNLDGAKQFTEWMSDACRGLRIFKVEYSDTRTIGTQKPFSKFADQNHILVVVARKIRFLERVA